MVPFPCWLFEEGIDGLMDKGVQQPRIQTLEAPLPDWQFRLRTWTGYLLLLPAVLFILVVIGYSLGYTFWISLTTNVYGQRESVFVGTENYINLLQDTTFHNALLVTTVFTVASVVLHLIIGGVFAMLLNARWFSPFIRNIFRGALLLPWIFSFAASGLIWGLLYHPFGVLNYLLESLSGISVEFLADERLALWSLVMVNVWKTFPFYMLMILGGLQSIPTDLYEAARVDGAGAVQRFRHITLPLLRPILVAITLFDIITSFGHYDLARMLTEGGPYGSTQTIAYFIWMTGFRDADFGHGAATSIVVLVALMVTTIIYLKFAASKESLYGESTTGI
jgi:multiple sugar transport system permease protein